MVAGLSPVVHSSGKKLEDISKELDGLAGAWNIWDEDMSSVVTDSLSFM
jgi:hypothetical protein